MIAVRELMAGDLGAAVDAFLHGGFHAVSVPEREDESPLLILSELPPFRRTGLYGIDL